VTPINTAKRVMTDVDKLLEIFSLSDLDECVPLDSELSVTQDIIAGLLLSIISIIAKNLEF
jgi:hypothetical protein